MITRILLATFLFVSLPYKKEKNIDIDLLLEDTQISNGGMDDVSICWWIPIEFWESSLQGQGLSKTEMNSFIDVIGEYEMFAVVQGEVNDFGIGTYVDESEIRKSIRLTTSEETRFIQPVAENEISGEMKVLLVTISPILENIMGDLGSNFHFFLFESEKSGDRLCNPYEDGTISILTAKFDYEFSTPVPSLIEKKVCPVDGELHNGIWKFCPHHGNKLEEQ